MMDGMYPGAMKVEVCRRLSDGWQDLADLLEIPLDHRARFRQGYEPQGIWAWLEQRERLGELRSALIGIGRTDVALLLPAAPDLEPWRRVLGGPQEFFAGRARALDHITDWLTRPGGRPVCVVTGDPGSGKSAVLARFALRQDPTGPVVAAVDARGLSVDEVVGALAEQAAVAAGTFPKLWNELARRPGPAGVVLDSVDESEEPAALMRTARAALRSTTHPRVRLLIGARHPLVPSRHSGVDVVDLDNEFADRTALEAYVRHVLGTNETFRASTVRAGRVAVAVARAARRSFLVAGLAAGAIVERGALPTPGTAFPREVDEAMEAYLDAVPVDRRWAGDLLRPLAYARGAGLPMPLWTLLAGELAGSPGKYTADDARTLLDGPLSAFVVVSRTQRPGEARSRAAYRLFHEALDEHLAAAEPAFPEAPRPGAEARETVAAALVPPRWDDMDLYLRGHLADHAAGTSVLSRLLRSSGFLVRASPASVIRALPRADAADLTAAQAYESVVHLLSGPLPEPERHAYLVLAARRVADGGLAADWERDAPRSDWWPDAALWRRTARNRLLRRHPGAVAQVAAARPLGEHVVVSTDSEGTVAITGIADTESPEPAGVADVPVEAAVVAVVDGLPLVVTGDENGHLHTVDLPAGAVDGLTAEGAAVSALGWDAEAPTRVATGRRDGSLGLCSIFPPAVPPGTARAGESEVFALVAIGGATFAGATGAGTLFLWDTRLGRVTSVDDSLPRTTALAQADGAVVTGHDDGSVRYWPASAGRLLDPVEIPADRVRPPERRSGEAPAVVAVAAASPGGRLVVLAGDEEDEIAVVDVTTGRCWDEGLSGHEGPVWALASFVVGNRTVVAGGGEDQNVRLWQLDDLAVPVGDRTFLGAPWSPIRLAEHQGRLLCLAMSGAAGFAVLDALIGDVVAGPHSTPDDQDLSAAALAVVSGELRYAIGTGLGRVGIGVLGAEAEWLQLPEQEWIADVVIVDGLLYAVRADGWVHVLDLDLRRHPERDFRAGDDKVLRARLEDPGHLVVTGYSQRRSRWDPRTGRAAPGPAVGPPPFTGNEVTVGEVRVDVGASVRDLLWMADGRIAVATGHGVVLLSLS